MSHSPQSQADTLAAALASCPLVAILRGIRPDEVEAVADALVETGFTLLEVPLNSPDPLASIARIADRYGPHVLVGAGTVLSCADVDAVAAAGGRLIISPNVDPDVIRTTAERNLISLPGYFTPSEAFTALRAGATGLKLFPSEAASPMVLKAQKAILPAQVPVLAVGGVTPVNLAEWFAAGAHGAGIGSALYSAGASASDVVARAEAFLSAVKIAG
ncbi:2-dehydro-3-deoxy-6-phosphogalactonate aldolase [Novosphingobium flavum]|uniref:2-dehydro-3-deoxy-6-phosphogalactonate aldolase n=1 Tax=Novosphingobium aerophilum TaxID=2839843 RepID=A0A7X1F8M2_9SPHN|nr:2-dehydro-3-deoxy-6-phosphogalactonate aldolase [Novosphingobium aerophilum]MBC2652381.1 2-dehydro-3-deoxy-6-phosphogalactonate aldolase [Novosphingobium aerophilum]MBC2662346.1 2-dehydro-3-deoxy-6-phosphogalactonate aldolase [Novosphingobium aerophilum]